DEVFEVGRSLLAVRRPGAAGTATARPRAGRVPFNRPPGAPPPAPPLELRLPPAPAEPQRLRVPLAAAMAPLLLGLALWLVTRSAFALLFALGTPLMALAPALEERVLGRRQQRRQVRRFHEQLAGAGAA